MMNIAMHTGCSRRRLVTFRRDLAVRLRREHWGGLAFHRGIGELLELDEQAFEILAALSSATELRDLRRAVVGRAKPVPRLPEMARFLQQLERRRFVECVPANGDFGRLSARRCKANPPSEPWKTTMSRKRELSAPLVAHWAVTYRCNLACSFCYAESHPHREREPAAEVRRRIIERLHEWGVFQVAVGGGEPTVLSDFPELLAAIRRHGMVPNVTTNGVFNSTKILDALAEHAGTVHLSADRSELLNAARGDGVADRVKHTAQRLSDFHVNWGVNLLLTPHNFKSLYRSLIEMKDLGAMAVTLLRPKGVWTRKHWPSFPTSRDMELIAAAIKQFLKRSPGLRLFVDTALRGEWSAVGLLNDPEPDVFGCGGGERHVAITPVGDVYPCSHALWKNLQMGNLLQDELHQIWGSGRGRAARRRFGKLCRGTTCACANTVCDEILGVTQMA